MMGREHKKVEVLRNELPQGLPLGPLYHARPPPSALPLFDSNRSDLIRYATEESLFG
jgi:hypothetical protein